MPHRLWAAAALLVTVTADLDAAPVGLRHAVRIRNVLQFDRRQIRLAQDPRDGALYSVGPSGAISRVTVSSTQGESVVETVFTSRDHAIAWGDVQGFDIDLRVNSNGYIA